MLACVGGGAYRLLGLVKCAAAACFDINPWISLITALSLSIQRFGNKHSRRAGSHWLLLQPPKDAEAKCVFVSVCLFCLCKKNRGKQEQPTNEIIQIKDRV